MYVIIRCGRENHCDVNKIVYIPFENTFGVIKNLGAT